MLLTEPEGLLADAVRLLCVAGAHGLRAFELGRLICSGPISETKHMSFSGGNLSARLSLVLFKSLSQLSGGSSAVDEDVVVLSGRILSACEVWGHLQGDRPNTEEAAELAKKRTALHSRIATLMLNMADPAGDWSFASNYGRAFEMLTGHLLGGHMYMELGRTVTSLEWTQRCIREIGVRACLAQYDRVINAVADVPGHAIDLSRIVEFRGLVATCGASIFSGHFAVDEALSLSRGSESVVAGMAEREVKEVEFRLKVIRKLASSATAALELTREGAAGQIESALKPNVAQFGSRQIPLKPEYPILVTEAITQSLVHTIRDFQDLHAKWDLPDGVFESLKDNVGGDTRFSSSIPGLPLYVSCRSAMNGLVSSYFSLLQVEQDAREKIRLSFTGIPDLRALCVTRNFARMVCHDVHMYHCGRPCERVQERFEYKYKSECEPFMGSFLFCFPKGVKHPGSKKPSPTYLVLDAIKMPPKPEIHKTLDLAEWYYDYKVDGPHVRDDMVPREDEIASGRVGHANASADRMGGLDAVFRRNGCVPDSVTACYEDSTERLLPGSKPCDEGNFFGHITFFLRDVRQENWVCTLPFLVESAEGRREGFTFDENGLYKPWSDNPDVVRPVKLADHPTFAALPPPWSEGVEGAVHAPPGLGGELGDAIAALKQQVADEEVEPLLLFSQGRVILWSAKHCRAAEGYDRGVWLDAPGNPFRSVFVGGATSVFDLTAEERWNFIPLGDDGRDDWPLDKFVVANVPQALWFPKRGSSEEEGWKGHWDECLVFLSGSEWKLWSAATGKVLVETSMYCRDHVDAEPAAPSKDIFAPVASLLARLKAWDPPEDADIGATVDLERALEQYFPK